MRKRIFGAALALMLVLSFFTLFAVDASAASDMKASETCVKMIQDLEGFQAIPYWDYAQWTVGYGTECPEEDLERYRAEGIPVEEAQALFAKHMVRHEKAVNKFMDKWGLTLTQEQFDALISYTYNLGPNSLSKETYTIVQAITSGATGNELIYAFSIYCVAGGEFAPGLMRRRLCEANLWFHGVYDDYPPESYCYIYYDANGGKRDARAQGYDANLEAVPMSKPTRDGYVFVGWFTQAEGGVKVTSLDETHDGMTLYAHWQEAVVEPQTPIDSLEVTVLGGTVHIRCGPGVEYGIVNDVYSGEKLTITGTTEAEGMLWGKFDGGWIWLNHTNYFELVPSNPDDGSQLPELELPLYATVMNPDGINAHKGPHTTYPKLETLEEGKVLLLEEYIDFDGERWARCEYGWVKLSGDVLIHDETKVAHNFDITSTAVLAIRVAPGVENERAGKLSKNTTVKVYALALIDGEYWGRIHKGWINLTYTDFDVQKAEQYQFHQFGQWYAVEGSSCQAQGTERRECQQCGYTETRQAAQADHSYDSWSVVLQPDCTTEGREERKCTLCGHVDTRAIAALGHKMTAWTVTEEATCAEAGQEQRSCEVCEHQETREIAPLGHNFGAWYETKAPTATEFGEEQRDCQVCGHSEKRQILPTKHSFESWYVTQAPTCTDAGLERRDCKNCDHYEEREVEPLGHSLGQWQLTTAPTCTTNGEERRMCQRCDHYESRTVDPVDHSFGEWYESIAPTTEDYGQERRDCQNCDAFETRQLDKLPLPTVVRTYATITCSVLRIRSGPGTEYIRVGTYRQGQEVEILEIQAVEGNDWGRTEKGWIQLTGLTTLRYVEEVHTEHTYGEWYETLAPTTTACGQERRDCTVCDHYETRELPILTVETVTKVYATITCDYLSIRAGMGAAYKRMGKLYTGARVEILEQVTVNGVTWGRTFAGWIWLTGYATLETVTEEALETEPTVMTVIADSLSIRVKAGTSHQIHGTLYTNAQVRVYEIITIGTTKWARVDGGWVMAKYLK